MEKSAKAFETVIYKYLINSIHNESIETPDIKKSKHLHLTLLLYGFQHIKFNELIIYLAAICIQI